MSAPVDVLSPEEHLEVLALYARAATSVDAGDAEGFAGAFTEDGSFTIGAGEPMRGREALAKFVRDLQLSGRQLLHNVNNVTLELEGGTVAGRAYGLVIDVSGTEPRVATAGIYHDVLAKESGCWRIASRHFRPGRGEK
jgi:uncharacterized protein (TIGR02246 family)